MAQEAAAKYSQLLQLQHNQRRLNTQHDVLMQCCDMLQWLRLQHLQRPTQLAETSPNWTMDTAADACCCVLGQDEQQLLAELRKLAPLSTALDEAATVANDEAATAPPLSRCSNSSIGSCSSGSPQYSLAVLQDQLQLPAGHQGYESYPADTYMDTLSPVHDMLYLFRALIAQPPHPKAATMSLSELQDDYATTVCELSLNLTALQDTQLRASLQEEPLAAIHRIILRHYHLLSSMLLHRDGLLMAFFTSNCLTKEVQEQELQGHIDRALDQLKLTTSQQQLIGESMAVFKRLIAPVMQARHQLQCAGLSGAAAGNSSIPQNAPVTTPSAAADTNDGEGDVCSSEASFAGDNVEAKLLRRPSLQQQEKKVLSLRTLMKKVTHCSQWHCAAQAKAILCSTCVSCACKLQLQGSCAWAPLPVSGVYSSVFVHVRGPIDYVRRCTTTLTSAAARQ